MEPKNPPVLSIGLQAISNVLARDSLLESPFCPRSYLPALGIATRKLPQFLETNQTEILELIKGYLNLLSHTSGDDSLLRLKLFDSPCQCPIFPEFEIPHEMISTPQGQQLIGYSVGVRCNQSRVIDNMLSFVEVLVNCLDQILAEIQGSTIPRSRAWWRIIGSFVDDIAEPLVRTMSYWLTKTSSIFIFAFFGTLLDLPHTKIMPAMENYPDIRAAFDKRLHSLVAQPYPDLSAVASRNKLIPLDLVFRGAGCFAYMFHSNLWPQSTRQRFVTYLTPGARDRYTDICKLLTLAPKAGPHVQNVVSHDLPRLAVFAENLCTLFSGTLSPVVSKVLQDKIPQGTFSFYGVFELFISIKYRCHNSLRHASQHSNQLKDPPRNYYCH